MEVSGELTSDAVWDGDVLLQGDVVVPEGRTLRLRAGTRLSFAAKPRWSCAVFRSAPQGYPIEASAREHCDLVVFGRLEVDGADGNPVSLGGPEDRWGGISLLGRGSARIAHSRVGGAAGGDEALLQCFDDSRLELRNCALSRARIAVSSWGLSSIRVRDTSVEDVGCAFFCREGSTADLLRVRCRRAEQGVWAQNWALGRVEDCRFEDCAVFGAGAYDRSRLSVARSFFGGCGQGLLSASLESVDAGASEFRGNRIGVLGIEESRVNLRKCAIAASGEHGAKFSHDSVAAVEGCRFSGNRLGGIFAENEASVSVSDCAFDEPAAATVTEGSGKILSAAGLVGAGGRA